MKKATDLVSNVEIKEETVMNETAKGKDTTAKAGKVTKAKTVDEKKPDKKTAETKKEATGKQAEEPDKKSAEQIPVAAVNQVKEAEKDLTVISDIEKVRGEVVNHTPEEIDEFEKLCRQIHNEQLSMQKSYLKIAIPLYNVNAKKWFDILGDSDIYNFAKRVFGISRGRCSEFKKVVERFGTIDDSTKCCVGIKPEFQNYSVSQLIEMTKMSEDQQKLVSEGIPVSAMKKLRLSGALPETSSENKSGLKLKKKKYQLYKGDDLKSYDTLKSSLLARLAEFAEQHESEIRNIKITLSYEE